MQQAVHQQEPVQGGLPAAAVRDTEDWGVELVDLPPPHRIAQAAHSARLLVNMLKHYVTMHSHNS